MSKFSLYDENGYFVTEVICNTSEEAIVLLGVEENIDIVHYTDGYPTNSVVSC